MDPLGEALDIREDEEADGQQQQQQQQQGQQGLRCIRQLASAPGLGVLAAVMGDGAVALCRMAEGALHPLEQLEFSHWLCGPAAGCRCVALAAPIGLAALGCALGEVLLVRLDPPLGLGPDALGAGSSAAAATPMGPNGHGPSPFANKQQQQQRQVGAGAGGLAAGGYGGAADDGALFVRALHLGDWGHSAAQTGPVASLAWSPDCRAVAVGFAHQGLVVWSVSGCRLMCTVRQPESARTPRAAASGGGGAPAAGVIDGGVQAVAWGALSYSLIIAGAAVVGSGSSSGGAPAVALPEHAATAAPGRLASGGDGGGGLGSQMLEIHLAKSLGGNHGVAQVVAGVDEPRGELHMLQAADRLLLISESASMSRPLWRDAASGADASAAAVAAGGGAANDLAVTHAPLPASYCAANWPLVHAAASPSGGDVAVSGRRGLAVYSRHAERWRLFGDVSQVGCASVVVDRAMSVHGVSSPSQPTNQSNHSNQPTDPTYAGAPRVLRRPGMAGQPRRRMLRAPRGPGDGSFRPPCRRAPPKCGQRARHQRRRRGGGGGRGRRRRRRGQGGRGGGLPDPGVSEAAPGFRVAGGGARPEAGEGRGRLGGVGVDGHCTSIRTGRRSQKIQHPPTPLCQLQVPSCMDCVGNHIIIASLPLELTLLQFDAAHGRLVAVRELSIFNVGRPLQGLAIVPPQALDSSELVGGAAAGATAGKRASGASGGDAATVALAKAAARGAAGPRQAVLLRWGGALSVLDLDSGSELQLANEVECFWLSGRLPVGPGGAAGSRLGSASGSGSHSRTSSTLALPSGATVHGPLAAADSAAVAGGVLALREALGSLQLRQAEEGSAGGGDQGQGGWVAARAAVCCLALGVGRGC